ncbi:hypothetical protein [Pseudoxanthomonas koreensis]|uniref:hypothetical protein n=1 Tax=Pseudoxanthomonas koreensis TaxID=266061 RepID=UPI0035A672BC
MNKKLIAISISLLFTLSCTSYQQYDASSPAVLVKSKVKVWIKPGATEEDKRIVGRQCGEDIRNDEELRKKGALSNEWSAAFRSCMERNGYRHYKDK